MKIHTQNVKKQYFLGVQIIWAGSTMMPPEAVASGSSFSGVVAHFHSLLALGGQVPCLEYQNVSLPVQFTAFSCISLTGTWSDWEQLKKLAIQSSVHLLQMTAMGGVQEQILQLTAFLCIFAMQSLKSTYDLEVIGGVIIINTIPSGSGILATLKVTSTIWVKHIFDGWCYINYNNK